MERQSTGLHKERMEEQVKAEELEKEIPQVIANETKEKGRYVSRDYNGDLLEAVRERLGDLLDDFPVNP